VDSVPEEPAEAAHVRESVHRPQRPRLWACDVCASATLETMGQRDVLHL